MRKPRRFKTRNGSIIEESKRKGSIKHKKFIDDYIIIDSKSENKAYENVGYVCLELNTKSYPKGGMHGNGWDIIEEIKEVKKSWWRFWK